MSFRLNIVHKRQSLQRINFLFLGWVYHNYVRVKQNKHFPFEPQFAVLLSGGLFENTEVRQQTSNSSTAKRRDNSGHLRHRTLIMPQRYGEFW